MSVCDQGQRRSAAKSPTAFRPSKLGDQLGAAASHTGVGGADEAASEQLASDVERSVQKREQLEAQLVLQHQLHNELQQHLKLQQEHHQLQAQLMVSCGLINKPL